MSRGSVALVVSVLICGMVEGQPAAKSESERSSRVLRVLDLRPGQVVADIGCGSGWLSAAAAEAVGPEGHVFAVEIKKSLAERVRSRGIPNVTAVHSRPHDVSLPANSLDVALLHDVASHVAKNARRRFYESVARALRPRGRLFIFDPHGGASRIIEELDDYGFVVDEENDLSALSPRELDLKLKQGIRFRYRKIAVF